MLHVSKEEREAALMQPLCELILDWSQKQWLDDVNLTLDNFAAKVSFLYSLIQILNLHYHILKYKTK